MSILHWVQAKSVDHAIAEIMAGVVSPAHYGDALNVIRQKYEHAHQVSDVDMILLNRGRRLFATQSLVEQVLHITGNASIGELEHHIDAASIVLAQRYKHTLDLHVDSLHDFDRAAYRMELVYLKDNAVELERSFSRQWRVALNELIMEFGQLASRRETILEFAQRGVAIKHVTDVASAAAIIVNRFEIAGNQIAWDDCANFYAATYKADQGEKNGCTLYFTWSGPIVEGKYIDPHGMQPNILHRNGLFRFALRPGSTESLMFTHADFQTAIEGDQKSNVLDITNRRGKMISVERR